ncbi:hypothetical protein [Streptomyces milbemycinicus]|uniref:Uncharacterized protein n=1 Tax=Streptomyces milbemycinicus TaxID=476552 RepID=A0ABW8M5S8_9ACTN
MPPPTAPTSSTLLRGASDDQVVEQRTAFGAIDSLADAVGALGDRSITQRLDTIERVLFALAPAQGIDPDNAP